MITAKDLIGNEDLEYAVSIRRELHRNPELGFDLPQTVALVKRELEKMGIDWIDSYAPCSVAGYIGQGTTTIGLRTDMDALPVQEKTGLPFASNIPGRMHACGHDAHTAILLALARALKRNEDKLGVRVKLLFQPSEECETSGAKAMLEGGAVDDVDCVVCTHCLDSQRSGNIGYHFGHYMAACDPVTITFLGKTAHATMPEKGIDAIAMAYEAMGEMKQIVSQIAGERTYIFSYGFIQGGTAHNVIADQCTLKVSFRYFDMEMAKEIKERCIAACEKIATQIGGSVEIDWKMSAPPVYNDNALTESFVRSVRKIIPEKLEEVPLRNSTEDFAWFLTKKPGFIFRFGTNHPEKGCTGSLHGNDFVIDEDSMLSAILAFAQFVMDCSDTAKE